MTGALFASREPVALSRSAAVEALASGASPSEALSGAPKAGSFDPGAIVCSCFSVGVNQIQHAVLEGGLVTVDAVGAALSAGTNCGSCRPEIQALIDAAQSSAPKIAAE